MYAMCKVEVFPSRNQNYVNVTWSWGLVSIDVREVDATWAQIVHNLTHY